MGHISGKLTRTQLYSFAKIADDIQRGDDEGLGNDLTIAELIQDLKLVDFRPGPGNRSEGGHWFLTPKGKIVAAQARAAVAIKSAGQKSPRQPKPELPPMHSGEQAMIDRLRREGSVTTTIDSGAVRILMQHLKRRGLVKDNFQGNGRTVWRLA